MINKRKQNKTKSNLQKIEPEKLLKPLIINVFNLKKKKGGCRAQLNVFNLKKNEIETSKVYVSGVLIYIFILVSGKIVSGYFESILGMKNKESKKKKLLK